MDLEIEVTFIWRMTGRVFGELRIGTFGCRKVFGINFERRIFLEDFI